LGYGVGEYMPTGYTAKLMRDGQTFEEFVMGCARAFGALVSMRDEPMDATIPEKFKPSSYHVEEYRKSSERLIELINMSSEDRLKFGEEKQKTKIESLISSMNQCIMEDNRLRNMMQRVALWTPPTKDHEELKKFMMQQLEVSMNGTDYYEKELKNIKSKEAIDFYNDEITSIKRDIDYHGKELVKERDRCESRTKWVSDLRKSIKGSEWNINFTK